jgi:hypothetical protein
MALAHALACFFVVCWVQNMCITVTVMQAHNRAPMSSSNADWREWLQWVQTTLEEYGCTIKHLPLLHSPYRDKQLTVLQHGRRMFSTIFFDNEKPDPSQLFAMLDRTPADVMTMASRHKFMENLIDEHRVVSPQEMKLSGTAVNRAFRDAFLGLKKLRGPVDYCFLEGFKIGIVLLGDWHTGSICTKSCMDNVTCKSMQAIKTSQGAVPSGVDMSFLDYLDSTFGHLNPLTEQFCDHLFFMPVTDAYKVALHL